MTATATSPAAPTWRPGLLHVKARPDLHVSRQQYEGQTYFVIKNPASRKYFRLRPEGYFVLQQLDGAKTVEEICEAYSDRFPTQHVEPNDLNTFIEELRLARFLHVTTPLGIDGLYEDYRKRHIKKTKEVVTQFLFLRIPIIDPDRLLERMQPYVRWAFSTWFRVFSVLLMATALSLVVFNFEVFAARLGHYTELFTWRNLIYFWMALGVAKVLHEFGHGLTCKYYGGEVHEMGVLFLIFTPCLYCNVSDAWMIRQKRQKIAITLAGIYVEIFLASLATLLWWTSEPGFLNSLCLALMLVCSISTIMFNGNPLLRYDGYYALADWLEIPNLRTKANQAIWNTIGKLCAGVETPRPYMPQRRLWLFGVYAVASYVYRWVVMISIVYFLYTFLKPHKLAVISIMLGLAGTVLMFFMPLYKGVTMLWKRRGRLEPNYKRLAVTSVVLAGLVALVFWVPFPFRVGSSLMLRPEDSRLVYVEAPGRLTELLVADGQPVKEGDPLALLQNEAEQIKLTDLQQRARELTALENQYIATGNPAGQNRVRAAQAYTTQAIIKQQETIGKLTLKAPRDGVVLLDSQAEQRIGSHLPHGTPVCTVADPKRLQAMLVINQDDVLEVREGATVRMQIYSEPGKTVRGTVRTTSHGRLESLPSSLTQAAAGDVAARIDPKTGEARPVQPSYVVLVDFDEHPLRLWPGVRGYAKIDCGTRTLAGRAWRWILRTFSFKLGL